MRKRRIFLFIVIFFYFCNLNYVKSTINKNMRKIFTLLLLATIAITMHAQATSPSFTTAAGTYYNPFSIELTGNNIYYTLDGTTPTENSIKYTGAISVSKFGTSTTIKAASYTNNVWSEVVSATYELKVAAPVFSIKGGVYEKLTNDNAITFSTETTGATIWYNALGKDPKTEGSKPYGALSVLATNTIKAVAFVKDDNGNKIFSDITSEHYAISPIALFLSANKVNDNKYTMNCGKIVASSFFKNIESGNLNCVEIANAKNKYIETNNFNGFTFTAVDGGYTIQDAYSRYLSPNNDNGFNATKTKPATGAVWSISIDSRTSLATIKNTTDGKVIAYDKENNVFGAYSRTTSSHTLPALYEAIEYNTITIAPADGDTLNELSKITITCDSKLEYNETLKLYAYYKIGNDFSKNLFDNVENIDDNTIEFTLDEPIKSNNEYSVIFPAGTLCIDPDGLAKNNKEIIIRYTVITNDILEVTYANPGNKESLDSLQYLYFEFNQAIEKNIANAVITDKVGNEYPLSESKYDPWGDECGENVLCLKTNDPIETDGEFTFVLKKENVCAKENNELTIDKNITYTFTVVERLKIKDMNPNSSDIYDTVDNITISLNKAAFHENITEIIVKDSNNKEYIFTKTTTDEESESLTFTSATPITDAGTYSFTIENNVIYRENPNSDINEIDAIPETTFTFIVKYPTSIKNINAEKENIAIYDLTGRRMKKITNAGIYIVNGRKTIVK